MSANQWSGTPHGYASNVTPAQRAFECAVCKQHKPAGTLCVGHCNHNRAPYEDGTPVWDRTCAGDCTARYKSPPPVQPAGPHAAASSSAGLPTPMMVPAPPSSSNAAVAGWAQGGSQPAAIATVLPAGAMSLGALPNPASQQAMSAAGFDGATAPVTAAPAQSRAAASCSMWRGNVYGRFGRLRLQIAIVVDAGTGQRTKPPQKRSATA